MSTIPADDPNPADDAPGGTPAEVSATLDPTANERSLPKPRSNLSRLAIYLILLAIVSAGAGFYWYWNQPDQCFRRGLDALARGDMEQVHDEMTALKRWRFYEAQECLLSGAMLLAEGSYEDALEDLGYSVEHPQTRAMALTMAGEALYKQGDFRNAENLLLIAVDADPNRPDPHRWLAAGYYDTGAMNQAVDQLTIVSKLDSNDSRPQRLLGIIFRDFGKYETAIEAYTESLRRQPDQEDRYVLMYEKADCQRKLLQHKDALQTLEECKVPKPKSEMESKMLAWISDVWALKADCQVALGKKKDARRSLDLALEATPDHLESLLLRADLFIGAHKLPEAETDLLKVAETYPTHYVAHYKLSQLYRQMGKEAQAQQWLTSMRSAQALQRQFSELNDQAIQQPRDARLRYQLGVVARKLDMKVEALGWFRAAVALEPSNEEARKAMDELASELGFDSSDVSQTN